MVGDIYLAKIYFTNLREYKIRPVLVIKQLGRLYLFAIDFTAKKQKTHS